MYQGKKGDTSICEQDNVISKNMQSARQTEVEASLQLLDISSRRVEEGGTVRAMERKKMLESPIHLDPATKFSPHFVSHQ